MKERIEHRFCEICTNPLVLNYSDRGPESGVCDECGAMYAYDLVDGDIRSVKYAVDFEIETEVISEYYRETGKRAHIISHFEHEDSEVTEFLEWARENYPDLGWAEP